MMRKFEFVRNIPESAYKRLPERSTAGSAGYDFYVAEDITIEPQSISNKPTIVNTYVKAYMNDNEVLLLFNRSSNPSKRNLVMANSVGVIDSDYVDNEENEGSIGFPFYNIGDTPVHLKAGEKLGQGLFMNYLLSTGDSTYKKRTGGFGSTGL